MAHLSRVYQRTTFGAIKSGREFIYPACSACGTRYLLTSISGRKDMHVVPLDGPQRGQVRRTQIKPTSEVLEVM